MSKSICVTTLCLCLSLLGCGGTTPDPENPEHPRAGDTTEDGAEGDTGSGGDQAVVDPSDPETTEEVIETSGPLE